MTSISFKGRHFQQDMILQSVRWYLAYALSYQNIEEIMKERGFDVDLSTILRWVVYYVPLVEQKFCLKKRKLCGRWRFDETYIKAKGEWKYYYRAVDKYGETIDFLLTAKRDKKAALRYLKKTNGTNGKPRLISIDKSGANTAAIKQYDKEERTRIKILECQKLPLSCSMR